MPKSGGPDLGDKPGHDGVIHDSGGDQAGSDA
jgi:hypothetical protein